VRHTNPAWPTPPAYRACTSAEYQRWFELAYGAPTRSDSERALLALAMQISPDAWRLEPLWKERVPSLVTAARVTEHFNALEAARQVPRYPVLRRLTSLLSAFLILPLPRAAAAKLGVTR
jgi:hypothetical protein